MILSDSHDSNGTRQSLWIAFPHAGNQEYLLRRADERNAGETYHDRVYDGYDSGSLFHGGCHCSSQLFTVGNRGRGRIHESQGPRTLAPSHDLKRLGHGCNRCPLIDGHDHERGPSGQEQRLPHALEIPRAALLLVDGGSTLGIRASR